MKSPRYMSVRYVVLVLCVLLVASSLDSIPDPLAVSPHAVNSKAFGLREMIGAFQEQRMDCRAISAAPLLPLRCFVPAYAGKLHRPCDEIALTGYAADPSPPIASV
jgi:hypothetical protein